MPQVDTTGDNDGKGKKKVKKIMSMIGKALAGPLIPVSRWLAESVSTLAFMYIQ